MVQAPDDTSTTNVTPLRPEQPRSKDPTGAERQARFRQNLRNGRKKKGKRNNRKRGDRAPTVTVDLTPTVTPVQALSCAPPISLAVTPLPRETSGSPDRGDAVRVRHGGAVDIAAYTAAIALAGAAAWFSIRGMVVLFPGSPSSVIVMAIAKEAAKLITAGWLARRWCATALIWRGALVAFVFGLAVINAAGVYAQLVAAHVGERGAAQSDLEAKDAALAAKLES
jgi:hypothetical protein